MTKPVEPTGATFFGFRFGGPVVQAASTVVEEEESEEESVDESEDESEYESTMNGDAGEEEEYIGEILLDGFVDEDAAPPRASARNDPSANSPSRFSPCAASPRTARRSGRCHR